MNRLCDRTNLGPDHAHPDDVPLPGVAPDPDAWAPELVDLDHIEALLGPPWTTLTPRPEYL